MPPQDQDEKGSAYLTNLPAMEELFYLKHGFAAGGSAVAEEIADGLLSTATALYQSGAYFRLRVVDVFEEARGMAALARLEKSGRAGAGSSSYSATCPPSPSEPEARPLGSLAVCHLAMRSPFSYLSAPRGSPLSAVRTGSRR